MIDSYLCSVVKIRNPKLEIRNKLKIRNSKNPKLKSESSLFGTLEIFVI